MIATTAETRFEIPNYDRDVETVRSYRGMPKSGTIAEIRAAGRKRFGQSFAGAHLKNYGGGSAVVVYTNHRDYAGRPFSKILAVYHVADQA